MCKHILGAYIFVKSEIFAMLLVPLETGIVLTGLPSSRVAWYKWEKGFCWILLIFYRAAVQVIYVYFSIHYRHYTLHFMYSTTPAIMRLKKCTHFPGTVTFELSA